MVSFVSEKYDPLPRPTVPASPLRREDEKPKLFRAVTRRPAVGMATTGFERKTRHLRPILIARYRVYNVGNCMATVSRGHAASSLRPDGRF